MASRCIFLIDFKKKTNADLKSREKVVHYYTRQCVSLCGNTCFEFITSVISAKDDENRPSLI